MLVESFVHMTITLSQSLFFELSASHILVGVSWNVLLVPKDTRWREPILLMKQIISHPYLVVITIAVAVIYWKIRRRIPDSDTRLSAITTGVGPFAELRAECLLSVDDCMSWNTRGPVHRLSKEPHWLSGHGESNAAFIQEVCHLGV